MSNPAKVTLSAFEAMLVNNSEWILTKHAVMQKAGDLLWLQVPVINDVFIGPLKNDVPELARVAPKISKGERYRNLPWVILDYPAVFSKTDVCALRTMFWWGNFISVTLHLSGKYKNAWQDILATNLANTSEPFYISIGEEQWEHHFGEENYAPVAGLDATLRGKKIVQPSFIKIALKYDLGEWNNMDELLSNAYSSFAELLEA